MIPFAERQSTINQVIEACEVYWLLNRLPRATVNEMGRELRDHLNAAVDDGKLITDVVSTDLEAFAASWQEAYPRPKPAMDVLGTVAIALANGLVGILTFQHLVNRAWTFPVSWMEILLVMVIAVIPLVVIQPGVLLKEMRSWPLQMLAWSLMMLAVVVPALLSRLRPQPLFLWDWPLTAGVVMVASVLTVALLRIDPSGPRRSLAQDASSGAQWRTLFGLSVASVIGLLLWSVTETAGWQLLTAVVGALSLYGFWAAVLHVIVRVSLPPEQTLRK